MAKASTTCNTGDTLNLATWTPTIKPKSAPGDE